MTLLLRPVTFYSSALFSRKTCYVLLPDSYEHSDKHYPVIYLLHGMYHGETEWWVKGNAQEKVEAARKNGELPEAIIVMPNDGGGHQGTFYMDWYDGSGNYGQYFMDDLLPVIESQFRTVNSRESRVIGGLSMGGFGSFLLALRNPYHFGAAVSFSGPIGPLMKSRETDQFSRILGPVNGKHAQEHDIVRLARRRLDEGVFPELLIHCGKEDYLYEANVWYRNYLQSIHYPFQYKELAGAHNWDYWREHLGDALRFFGAYLTTR